VRDPDDFDVFYAGTVRRVTSYLYTVTGSRAEAEDAAQEAYARAWQRWDKISGYGDPEGWVRTVGYRIAVNTWRKAVTRAAAHRRHGVPDDQPGLSPDYLAIVAALRKISPGQRQAIVLRETRLPAGTVKARLSRGRQALAPLLGERAPGPGFDGREVPNNA
jgi:RNA polymerase sigma-70 factor (ECF subfamily)